MLHLYLHESVTVYSPTPNRYAVTVHQLKAKQTELQRIPTSQLSGVKSPGTERPHWPKPSGDHEAANLKQTELSTHKSPNAF